MFLTISKLIQIELFFVLMRLKGEDTVDTLSIFISSVAQDSLTSLRKEIAKKLQDVGHHVICYEESIHFTELDSVKTCLNYVENSDLLLLFIDNKAGSLIVSEGKTVTHLEFLKAFEEGKQILVYVNHTIKSEFFGFLTELKNKHDLYESSFKTFCDELTRLTLTHIQDSYVLAFLYDAYVKGFYLHTMNLGLDTVQQVKTHLSVMMKEGLQYLSLKTSIDQAFHHFQMYGDFYENSLKFLEVVRKGEIIDSRRLLSRLRNLIVEEIEVFETDTIYQTKSLTSMKSATAITLYVLDGDMMRLLEYDGDVTAESIPLENRDSYVVQTAENDSVEETLYYNEDKHLFYFLFKVNDYVFCIHFPATGEMTNAYALKYQKHVFDAIIKSKGYQYCYFLKKLLGG